MPKILLRGVVHMSDFRLYVFVSQKQIGYNRT